MPPAKPFTPANERMNPGVQHLFTGRSPAGARTPRARTAPALSRKMSTQILGFAPAIRVMSRNDPPALASGSCPSIRDAPA